MAVQEAKRDIESQEPERSDGFFKPHLTEPVKHAGGAGSKAGPIGGHALWKRGPVDDLRAYLLSEGFQACVQLALSESCSLLPHTCEHVLVILFVVVMVYVCFSM